MNKPNEFDDDHQPIEIPVPEHAPEPASPEELPDIIAHSDSKTQSFMDTDEIVPQKEKPGEEPILAPESGKSLTNKATDEEKDKCKSDNEPLGQPPYCDPEGNGEDVN